MAYKDLLLIVKYYVFITPFHEDGSINFDAIPDLIEHLWLTTQMGLISRYNSRKSHSDSR